MFMFCFMIDSRGVHSHNSFFSVAVKKKSYGFIFGNNMSSVSQLTLLLFPLT